MSNIKNRWLESDRRNKKEARNTPCLIACNESNKDNDRYDVINREKRMKNTLLSLSHT